MEEKNLDQEVLKELIENYQRESVNFDNDFGRLVEHLNRLRNNYMRAGLNKYGMNNAMQLFLLSLMRWPNVSQDFFAEHFYMDKGNVARNVRKLEEMGYIKREINPNDRRQYRISATKEGMELFPVLLNMLKGWSEHLSDGFTDEEKKIAYILMLRMEANAERFFGTEP